MRENRFSAKPAPDKTAIERQIGAEWEQLLPFWVGSERHLGPRHDRPGDRSDQC